MSDKFENTMPRKRKEPLSGSEDENEQGAPRKHSKNAHPLQRYAANERERSRMRVLSKAFSKLKTTLPWVPSDTKLSKLDTLRLASSYIAHLKQILESEEEDMTANNPSSIHPLNLTWPFSFQGRVETESNKSDKSSTNSSSSCEQNLDDIVVCSST